MLYIILVLQYPIYQKKLIYYILNNLLLCKYMLKHLLILYFHQSYYLHNVELYMFSQHQNHLLEQLYKLCYLGLPYFYLFLKFIFNYSFFLNKKIN